MISAQAEPVVQSDVGRWRVWAKRPGYDAVDVTFVRGAPTTVGDFAFADPFGPRDASLTFPTVTMYDLCGQGELFWLAPEVDFTIEWAGPLPASYPYERWVWEGYSLPIEYGQDQVSVTLIGAMLQLDDGLAKPEHPGQPIPYEVAIARQWRTRGDLRIKPLEVQFPSWWTETYTPKLKEVGAFIPVGVAPGAKWTGLLTRETGSWDKALTSYIQSLLASMYTQRGRWTLDLMPDRRPVLMHRDFAYAPSAATVVIQPTQPGVEVSLTEDWSQSANVLYGQAKAITGETYSASQIIEDGQRTVYLPLAALRQVEPTTNRNTWLELSRMRREIVLQTQEGLSAKDLIRVGQAQLQTMSDPGVNGTITLSSDCRTFAGDAIARHLIRAGMSVLLPNFKGNPDGIMLHITEASYSAESESITLTVDSKYRDQLTVAEVRNRGRDALNVPRMLLTGKVVGLLPDSLVPWNYAEGSGYIPSSPGYSARRLFEDIDEDLELTFPFEDLTRRRPPRSASWRTCYIRIGPSDLNNADKNWAYTATRGGTSGGIGSKYAIPIKMASAGSIRSLQMAAYDADGNILRVPFHVSLYYQKNTSVEAMPKIPAGKVPNGQLYQPGQHYPFFPGAFETYDTQGVSTGIEVPLSVATAGLIRGYGTQKVPAGFWPGAQSAGDPATGLLVDDGIWEWQLVGQASGQDQINPFKFGDISSSAGYLYMMIYCQHQLTQPVYFLGRMYRVEPGQQS